MNRLLVQKLLILQLIFNIKPNISGRVNLKFAIFGCIKTRRYTVAATFSSKKVATMLCSEQCHHLIDHRHGHFYTPQRDHNGTIYVKM